MQDFDADHFSSDSKKPTQKPKEEMGEYIDYEEIDWAGLQQTNL